MGGEETKAVKAQAKAVEQPEEVVEELDDSDSMMGMLREWMRNQAPWWAMSFTVHMVLLSSLLLLGRFAADKKQDDIPSFDEAQTPPVVVDAPLKDYEIGDPNPDPTVLDTRIADGRSEPSAAGTETAQYNDDNARVRRTRAAACNRQSAAVADLGGRGGFEVKAFGPGPKIHGGGIGAGVGAGNNAGSGGDDNGFGSRGTGSRKALLGRYGGTRQTERAVAAALYWLANHQSNDGSWSLRNYQKQCKDKSCTGPGGQESLSAATAMGLLPYLAAGQTHSSAGPFQRVIGAGVYWLISHQQADGDLSAKAGQQMYSHGLAAIALCEDYGMSRDRSVGVAAQKAINFIEAAQNTNTGGWRYHPGEEGDTSVVGWQLMAIKSAEMAGLQVNPGVLEGTKKWLNSVSKGGGGSSSGLGGGQFSYQPGGGAMPTTSAVGLLCSQYLHAGRQDPVIVGGVQYLMANQPDKQTHNLYYWYYATQVMHNMADKDWDTWNRKMRTILVNTQSREGCANGSWDPDKPQRDVWGGAGGRVMMTSLSALTLEVYYRYLPLYKLDKPEEIAAAEPMDKPGMKK